MLISSSPVSHAKISDLVPRIRKQRNAPSHLHKSFNFKGIQPSIYPCFLLDLDITVNFIRRQLTNTWMECYRRLYSLNLIFEKLCRGIASSILLPARSPRKRLRHSESQLCDLSIKISIKAETESIEPPRFLASVSIARSLADEKFFVAVPAPHKLGPFIIIFESWRSMR